MNKQAVLARLALGEPLFDSFPRLRKKRICGTEIEFGVVFKKEESILEEDPRLPSVLWNGGEVYVDNGHLEYASPESSNAVSAVAYYEAGKLLCQQGGYCAKLYCHNNDWSGQTFGAHESYFTRAPRLLWNRLVPFLIARTILCGSGWINPKGEFEVSQRAAHITHASSESTTSYRGVLNLRDESLAKVPGWDRLHIICGDAGMSQMSTFLRIGTMSLVVEMLEQGACPYIPYDTFLAGNDMLGVSRYRETWCFAGIQGRSQNALDVLHVYLSRAKGLFSHRDMVTDAILAMWEDTLERLRSDQKSLWRRLDWVLKRQLLELWREEQPNGSTEWFWSQDMEYHNLNPLEGLYFALHPQMEHLVSDELIRTACVEPPYDTRAYLRGTVAQYLAKQGKGRSLCANGWQELIVVDTEHSGRYYAPDPNRLSLCYVNYSIPNPFENYQYLLPKIQKVLA